MPTSQRINRVSDEIQKTLARLIQQEMKDPRIGFVTVSGVKVSKDFSFADIYLSWLQQVGNQQAGDQKDSAEALMVIRKAGGFLRTALSKELRLRVTPKLRFHHDQSAEEGQRMAGLIRHAVGVDKELSSNLEVH